MPVHCATMHIERGEIRMPLTSVRALILSPEIPIRREFVEIHSRLARRNAARLGPDARA